MNLANGAITNIHDQRKMRAITLKNQLQVLLMSDPKVKKSAAAMDVNVGSLADPKEYNGLAHFLEHMLFLGTKKYPEVGEYDRYLRKHQGYSNAYTAPENTNYYLEVNHDALEGALDRFAQFFIAPTFDEKFVEREMNAVHSEFQKFLENDYWRNRMILHSLHAKGHAKQNFTVGNLETLKSVDRKTLIKFYEKHYSANTMRLAVLSNASLDQLEKWIRSKFSAVKNTNNRPPVYSSKLFDAKDLPLKVEIEPIKEQRELNVYFAVPSTDKFWKTRPTAIIGHLLGHEGEGSLLSELKRKGWAISLSAGNRNSSFAGLFTVTVALSKKGLKDYQKVVSHIFAYLNLLRKEGYKRFVFDEEKALAEIDFKYRDLEEGGNVVSYYAQQMQKHPALEIDKRVRLLSSYSKTDFETFLGRLQPEVALIFLAYRGAKTDKTEKWYGTKYSVSKISPKLTSAWRKAQVEPDVFYPKPNRFIPRDLGVLPHDRKTARALLSSDAAEFWFEQDSVFKLPKAKLSLQLLSPAPLSSPKDRLLHKLYVASLYESLNEWRYPLSIASLDLELEDLDRGLRIRLTGFSDHMPEALLEVLGKLKTISLSNQAFLNIREAFKRQFISAKVDQAYRQALYELQHLTSPKMIHRDEYADLIDKITLAEVKGFSHKLFSRIALFGAAYGNLQESRLKAILNETPKILGAKPLPRKQWPLPDTVKVKNGEAVAISKLNESNNGAWAALHFYDKRQPATEAFLRVAAAHLGNHFYTELRTRQQLGYIVASNYYETWTTAGLMFLVQSGTHASADVGQRIKKWEAMAIKELKDLPDEVFQSYKLGIVNRLKQKATTIDERLEEIFTFGILLKNQFDYEDKVIDELKGLNKKEFVDQLKALLNHKKGNRFVAYLDKKGAKQAKPPERTLKNIQQFRNEALVW